MSNTRVLLKARRVPQLLAAINGFDKRVLAAYREAIRRFGHKPWVTGVTIGIKERGGELRRDVGPVITIHVVRKIASRRVRPSRRIPRKMLGIPTDVVGGRFVRSTGAGGMAVAGPSLKSGDSISRVGQAAGTFGAVIRRGNTRFLLSAGHVLRSGGVAAGRPIVHPASGDSPPPSTVVARLTTFNLDQDAAIGEIEAGVDPSNTARSTGVAIGSPKWAAQDDILELNGRTTAIARGVVTQVGLVQGLYPAIALRPLPGDPLPITQGGDSGAIWYDATTAAAKGLHVGIKKATGESLAVMLPAVLAEMPGGPFVWW
jgi:hypothetical protein